MTSQARDNEEDEEEEQVVKVIQLPGDLTISCSA